MPVAMIYHHHFDVDWAGRLFDCLQEMAARKTNVVLLTLANVDRLECEQHYPESGLTFGNNRWKAYYHCHDAATKRPGEHGHFHIFIDTGEPGWAHVAALSIDETGQPLQWFAVNRWVTDGPWLESASLAPGLLATHDNPGESLVARWLVAMLQLEQVSLCGLLNARDTRLERCAQGRNVTALLEDPTLYTLASRSIDLRSILERHLLSRQTNLPDSQDATCQILGVRYE